MSYLFHENTFVHVTSLFYTPELLALNVVNNEEYKKIAKGPTFS